MNEFINEEDALKELLEGANREETVYLPLKGNKQLPVVLKALSEKQISQIRERCTAKSKDRKGRVTERLDEEQFNVALVVAATVKPDWGNPGILSEYKLSGPEEVLRRIAAGYLAALGDKILELSGFGVDIDTKVDEIKNS